jgi:hypothetical protein
MARLFTNGFESGKPFTPKAYDGESNNATSGDIIAAVVVATTVGTTLQYQATTVRDQGGALPTRAMRCNPSAANYVQIDGPALTASRPYFVRFYFRMSAAPSGTCVLWAWRLNAVIAADISINASSQLLLRDANSATVATSAALSADTWYMIEGKIVVPAAGNGQLELKLDGEVVGGSTSVDVNNALTPATHRLGHQNSGETAATMYFDDVAINDDQGANQNSYPGPGYVTYCIAATDNTKGTGWAAGAGGATLAPAVANVPPLGKADGSETNTTQITNATSTTNSVYSANCWAPSAYGVPANAVIKLAQGVGRVSANSATGTNIMEVESFTPAIAAVQVDAEFGTVAADDASNTVATGWKTAKTLVQYNPAMSSTTVPIVGVRKITAATREHYADQIGLLIEWTEPIPDVVYALTEPAPRGGQRG